MATASSRRYGRETCADCAIDWKRRQRCNLSRENAMGLEAVYFLGALVLLIALIYGTLSYHYRNRAATRAGDEIVRERYRQNQS
jgi:hypothetical protein